MAEKTTGKTGGKTTGKTGGKTDKTSILETDKELNETQQQIKAAVRRFTEEKILPDIAEWYEKGVFPADLVPEMAKLGVFGMSLEGYGCAGLDPLSYGIAMREIEAGDSGFRSFISVQGSLSMFAIYKYGSEEQKETWLPAMAKGEKLGCFGLTEPDAGSNPASMRTNAVQDGSDWVLNGTKTWITNGTIADIAIVWAQTDSGTAGGGKNGEGGADVSANEAGGAAGVRGFLVPTDSPGFSATEIKQKSSMRASITAEISLNDVRIPEDFRLPEAVGLKTALSCLSEARFGIVFGSIGAGRACLEAALDYAEEREVFGKPLSSKSLTQEKLVNMATLLGNSELIAFHLARRKADSKNGGISPAQISYGKRHNVAAAREIAREARSILGANGISLAYPPIRHMTNLESVYTYEGTHEIHTLVLGQRLTGHSAF